MSTAPIQGNQSQHSRRNPTKEDDDFLSDDVHAANVIVPPLASIPSSTPALAGIGAMLAHALALPGGFTSGSLLSDYAKASQLQASVKHSLFLEIASSRGVRWAVADFAKDALVIRSKEACRLHPVRLQPGFHPFIHEEADGSDKYQAVLWDENDFIDCFIDFQNYMGPWMPEYPIDFEALRNASSPVFSQWNPNSPTKSKKGDKDDPIGDRIKELLKSNYSKNNRQVMSEYSSLNKPKNATTSKD